MLVLTPSLVVGQVTPIMLNKIGYGTYILFGLLTFMGAGFIWFFVPETKRLTLEEMVRTIRLSRWRGMLMKTIGRYIRFRRHCSGRL